MTRPPYSPIKDIELHYENYHNYDKIIIDKKNYAITFAILFSIFSTIYFAYFMQKYF